jgi:hypothetical protein
MAGFHESMVCFFDCDDCLYFNDWGTAKLLTEKIEAHCIKVVHRWLVLLTKYANSIS